MSKWRCFFYPVATDLGVLCVSGPVRSGKSIFIKSPSWSLNVGHGWTTELPLPEHELIPFAPNAPMLVLDSAENHDDR